MHRSIFITIQIHNVIVASVSYLCFLALVLLINFLHVFARDLVLACVCVRALARSLFVRDGIRLICTAH